MGMIGGPQGGFPLLSRGMSQSFGAALEGAAQAQVQAQVHAQAQAQAQAHAHASQSGHPYDMAMQDYYAHSQHQHPGNYMSYAPYGSARGAETYGSGAGVGGGVGGGAVHMGSNVDMILGRSAGLGVNMSGFNWAEVGTNTMDPTGAVEMGLSSESGMDASWITFMRECGIMDIGEDP